MPSCIDCHGPDTATAAGYPKLAGMPRDYLIRQLELLAKRRRGGTQNAKLMHPAADALTENQRREVAAYYASLLSESDSADEE